MKFDLNINSNKKIGIFTDIHGGVEKDSTERLLETTICFDWITKTFLKNKVKAAREGKNSKETREDNKPKETIMGMEVEELEFAGEKNIQDHTNERSDHDDDIR
jgi:hypothetical protein